MKTIGDKVEDFVNFLEERISDCEEDINNVTLTNEQRLKSSIIRDEVLFIQGAFESCLVTPKKPSTGINVVYLGTTDTEDSTNIWFEVSGTANGEEDGEYGLSFTRGELTLLDDKNNTRDIREPQMKAIFYALKQARTASMMNE